MLIEELIKRAENGIFIYPLYHTINDNPWQHLYICSDHTAKTEISFSRDSVSQFGEKLLLTFTKLERNDN